MYPSVAAAFVPSVAGEEGTVSWPYLDNEGLVTFAIGILGEAGGAPNAMFLSRPWKHLDGSPASNADIRAAWQRVKSQQAWKSHGGGQSEWADLTDLRLDNAAVANATEQWLQQNEPTLRASFPGYDTMPADAQLALLGMSYAMGPAFGQGYPKLKAALNAVVPQYDVAAKECTINKNVTAAIASHNATNAQLFQNAAKAMHSQTPFSSLWWPSNVDPGPGGAMASYQGGSGGALARRSWLGALGWPARIALAGVAVTGGFFGVASVQAVRHGKPWTTPFVEAERSAARFGRSVDAKVRRLLPKGEKT